MKIDLRSDTVTVPAAEMLNAMMSADVGDDVFKDDPTINRLQDIAAERFGMEAALYCPSGTMTNQIAIKTHTQPGDEVICDRGAHVYNYEGGGIALNSGASVRLIDGDLGRFTAADVLNCIQPDNEHYPVSKLVVIENTSNSGGGTCWNFEEILKIKDVCDQNNLSLHLDGARLFHALMETVEHELDYGRIFDSISICLSKGLGAPVGSLLLGTRDFIYRARRFRKVFGGGMRQAGYLAAAGIYALENNVTRLKEDHRRARLLEKMLMSHPLVKSVIPVQTNIVIFSLVDHWTTDMVIDFMAERDIILIPRDAKSIRLVTHLNFTDEMLDRTVAAFNELQDQS